MAEIWEDLLGVERIGTGDNFFHLGGHSLKAIQTVARLFRDLSVEVTVQELFTNPTIAALARLVKQKELTGFGDIRPVEEREYYDVSNAQKRIWLISQIEEASISYNIPYAFILEGPLNVEALNRTFRTMIQRHEILRTSFIFRKGAPCQVVHRDVSFEVERLPLERDQIGEEGALKAISLENALEVFALDKPPLFRVALVDLSSRQSSHASSGKWLFLFNMHHIISDGWSLDIFFMTSTFDGVTLEQVRVADTDLDAAVDALTPELRAAIDTAIENVTIFHEHQRQLRNDHPRVG